MNRVPVQTDFSSRLAEALRFDYEYDPGSQTLRLSAERLGELFPLLAEDPRLAFDYLRDLTAKEQPPGVLHTVYNFLSFQHRHTLMVVATLPLPDEGQLLEVVSATSWWNSANWLEREVYDMFGIGFRGHPDMRRIFLDEAVSFHPLRKSFVLERVTNVRDLGEMEVRFTKEAREQMQAEEAQLAARKPEEENAGGGLTPTDASESDRGA